MRALLSVTVFLFFVSCLSAPSLLLASSISVLPAHPIQGEPIMVTVDATSTVSSISFESKKLGVFAYRGRSSALYGFDLNKKPGTYTVSARLADGSTLSKKIEVGERAKEQVAFTIPAKLGGDTPASQATLATTLSDENAGLLGLRTGTHAFWSSAFIYPTARPYVTDAYGYSRATGATTVTHKGADLRAPLGTPVMAINRGVVRLVRETRNYGKTVVVDHGLGLMSFYMHLSKISVNEGELVQKGQAIALSGQTGYAEQPHLHLTVRLNDVSIDPVVFLSLFR
ncbi:MAG TPA: M23 family metallopeptidase [Candidatus Paceibacterota bacterium]|nr:M23 family metallopeptidase [Candidatus Paceibacterota bacterium]